jgi:DNA-binding PadR family transcriptional regulator
MPMPNSHLHVLLVLAGGDAHGYAIMQATEELTEGAVRLRPGVLYAAIGKLVDDALVEETDERPAAELDDARRRYYRITDEGRRALGGEIARLERLVLQAQARAVEPGLA